MADNTVDSILLEINATTDKADGGIGKTIRNLKSLKEVTDGIDTEKLLAIRDVFNGFKTAGESLKQAGDGMRGIASAVKSLSGIDSGKLKEVARTVEKIGTGLGSLGSNNKISIRIDSNGIHEAIKPLENAQLSAESTANVTAAAQDVVSMSEQARNAMDSAAQSAERLSSAEERTTSAGNAAAAAQQALSGALNQTNTSSANAQIQELINRINEYKATISGMESGKQLFDAQSYEKAVSGLARVQEQFKQYQESVKNAPKTMDDVAKSIKSIGDAAGKCGLGTFSSLLNNIAAILPMIEIGGMAASAGFQSMAVGLQAVQAAIPIIGIILTLISALVNAINAVSSKIKTAFGKIKAGFKTLVNKIRVGVTKIKNTLGEWKNKFLEMFGIQNNAFESLRKKIKTFARLFTFMALRKIITKIFEGATEGFQNLAKYSKIYGTQFNNNVSLLYSDLKWLGNSISTVFEPILNYITPILDMLITKLVAATRALAQFFSALTGKKFYTKAIKNWEDYADSINSATKAIKDYTIGIDELNILNDNDGSGGGAGAIDPGDMFETEEVESKYKDLADMIREAWENADFYALGSLLGKKLNEALKSIPWGKIKATLRKIGKSIATFLNGFLETPGLFTVIGITIADAINSAFEFVDSFVENFHWESLGIAIRDLIIGALDTIDWPLIRKTVAGLAQGLVDAINAALQTDKLWIKMGTAIANTINAAILFAKTGILGLDWASLGKSVGNLLGNALAGIDYDGIGVSFAGFVNGIFTAVLNFSKTFPWTEVATNFANGINEALGNLDWNTIKSGFISFCIGLGNNLDAAIRGINWKEAGKALGEGINTLIRGIGSFIASIDPVELGNSIADFINGAFEAFNSEDATKTINMIINWLSQVFDTAIEKVNWQDVVKDIGTLLAGIDWKGIFYLCFKAIAGVWTFKNIFKGVSFVLIGRNIVSGIKEGIIGGMTGFTTWLGGNFTSIIVDAAKDQLGIHSPSTVFKEIGSYIVEGFLGGISVLSGNCKQKITEWAGNIKEWFNGTSFGAVCESTWEKFGTDVVSGFGDAVGGSYTSVRTNISAWASDIKDYFTSNGKGAINKSTWETYAGNTVSGYREEIGGSYTSVRTNISAWASDIKDYFTSNGKGAINKSTWETYAGNTVKGFREEIGSSYTTTRSNVNTWASDIRNYFTDSSHGSINSTMFSLFAQNAVDGFKNKIGSYYTVTGSNVKSWGSYIITTFQNTGVAYGNSSSGFYVLAKNVVDGFKNGIGAFYTTCKDNISSWGRSIISWFKETLGIESPSKVFSELGSFTIAGFNKGIEESGKTTKGIVQTWANSFSDVDIGFKVGVDASALKEYQNNYGADFTNKAMIERVQREVTTNGAVKATLNTSGGIKEVFAETFRDVLPILSEIATNTKVQADKEEQTIVQIGGKTVTDAVETQQSANGYRFRPT